MLNRWLLPSGLAVLAFLVIGCASHSRQHSDSGRADARKQALENHFVSAETEIATEVVNADQALITSPQAHHETPRHEFARNETPRHDTGQHDTGQHDTGQHDTGQHDTARHDTELAGSGVASHDADVANHAAASEHVNENAVASNWTTIVNDAWAARHVHSGNENLVFIDTRSAADYAAGHLSGAIHLPVAAFLHDPDGDGDAGADVYRDADGHLDVAHYHAMLGDAGIRHDHHVCVYGATTEASLSLMILDLVGHAHASLMPMEVVARFEASGNELSTVESTWPATEYHPADGARATAHAGAGSLWDLEQVFQSFSAENTVFVDARTADEYAGLVGDNRFGGHIPTAKHFDAAELLGTGGELAAFSAARNLATDGGIEHDHHVVLYGRDLTHVSFAYVVLRDLGFTDVSVYGAGWSEFGNRDDTPIDERTLPPTDH